ncbi:hypothetical protein BZA77DRAFT_294014 [Pyronema omphalodes]|nr:hypothetical protein BZA77DRAFT_294014 [Pyronema omphalodes]
MSSPENGLPSSSPRVIKNEPATSPPVAVESTRTPTQDLKSRTPKINPFPEAKSEPPPATRTTPTTEAAVTAAKERSSAPPAPKETTVTKKPTHPPQSSHKIYLLLKVQEVDSKRMSKFDHGLVPRWTVNSFDALWLTVCQLYPLFSVSIEKPRLRVVNHKSDDQTFKNFGWFTEEEWEEVINGQVFSSVYVLLCKKRPPKAATVVVAFSTK